MGGRSATLCPLYAAKHFPVSVARVRGVVSFAYMFSMGLDRVAMLEIPVATATREKIWVYKMFGGPVLRA